jgi:hypothetical protein
VYRSPITINELEGFHGCLLINCTLACKKDFSPSVDYTVDRISTQDREIPIEWASGSKILRMPKFDLAGREELLHIIERLGSH